MEAERSNEGGWASRVALEWAALGAAFLAFAALLAYDLRADRRAIENLERDRLGHQASIVEKELSNRLQATSNALEAIRDDVSAHRSTPGGLARLGEQMQAMVASMTGVRTFLLVNAKGIAEASNRRELLGIDFHEGERYRAIRARPDASLLYVSPPFTTPLGNWALSLGRAVLDGQGRFDGYVLAIIDPAYFDLLLESVRYSPDVGVAMVHGDGKIIYRLPDPKGAVGMDLSQVPGSAFTSHVQGGNDRSSTTKVLAATGAESLVVFQTLRPSRSASTQVLVVAFSRETSAMFAPWRAAVRDRTILLGAIALVCGIALRVHQVRRASTARLQAQVSSSARLAALGTLVAGVAHEINNPLTSVLANASASQELLREMEADLPAGAEPERLARCSRDLREMLADVEASAERIARVVKELAILARPVKTLTPVHVEDVVRGAIQLLPPALRERGSIRVEVEGAPEVMASPGQMEQVVVNLVANALLAYPNGSSGVVTVRAGPAGHGRVRLEVVDQGSGIDSALHERIFEPFFTTRPQGKGTGLGLAICHAIVHAHGGSISVESEVGKGATFRVELPGVMAAA